MDWRIEEKLKNLTWLFDAIAAQAKTVVAEQLWKERNAMLEKMHGAKKTANRLGYKFAARAIEDRANRLFGK